MRKMLNTLFVTSEDVYLALENENVVVLSGEEKRGQFPLVMLEGIVTFSYKGASPALMGACAKRGIGLSFMTHHGRFLARVCGEERGNVLLRKKQYRMSDDEAQSCRIARSMIFGKVYNSRWVLERAIRDHAMRVDAEGLKAASQTLAQSLEPILEQTDLELLRGIEGQSSALYFGRINDLILNQFLLLVVEPFESIQNRKRHGMILRHTGHVVAEHVEDGVNHNSVIRFLL